MTSTKDRLAELCAACSEAEEQIRAAYELGLRQGKYTDRENIRRNAQIDTTKRLLNTLMVSQKISLEEALVVLQIPRSERKTYIKTWQDRQKKAARSNN